MRGGLIHPWTDEELATARQLKAEGYGCGDIARVVGRSRGAVRLRLGRRPWWEPKPKQRPRWEVLLSDLADKNDRLVKQCRTEAGARALVKRLNREALARHGMPLPGKPVPLYYADRTQEDQP